MKTHGKREMPTRYRGQRERGMLPLLLLCLALSVCMAETVAHYEAELSEMDRETVATATEVDNAPTEWTEMETLAADTAGQQETDTPQPDAEQVEMLACVIYQEAGGDACSDLCRRYVGDVVLNRVADPRFPDTLAGVLTQKGQYGRYHWTGVVWPERASHSTEANAVTRAYDTATELLAGNHSDIYGAGYIWQAEFRQGKDNIFLDGLYFGR